MSDPEAIEEGCDGFWRDLDTRWRLLWRRGNRRRGGVRIRERVWVWLGKRRLGVARWYFVVQGVLWMPTAWVGAVGIVRVNTFTAKIRLFFESDVAANEVASPAALGWVSASSPN